MMLTAHHQSQFTQSLMLFSQTQTGGRRYNPHLTRFYAALPPDQIEPMLHDSLVALGVKCKRGPKKGGPPPTEDEEHITKFRVGGFDRRREMFKGWVEIEPFVYNAVEGSFCVMKKEAGSPISWRQLWKALIEYPAVEPHVLRKR